MTDLIFNEFSLNVLTTLVGVLAGGLLTIWVNSISEKKRIKLELQIKLLGEIKPLLQEYSMEVLESATYMSSLKDVRQYTMPDKNTSTLIKLISIFQANRYILFPFNKKFDELNKKRIMVELSLNDEKKMLNEFAQKYSEYNTDNLYKNGEVVMFLEENCKKYTELYDFINSFSNELDEYYLKKIFRYKE